VVSIIDMRLTVARALLRTPGARTLIRRAENHPVAARWFAFVADRLLGDIGNYRLALQSDARVPTDGCLDAVFALQEPARFDTGGPVVLVVDDLGPGGAQRQLALTAFGLKAAGLVDVRVLCRSPFSVSPQGGGFFRAEIERAGIVVEILRTSTGGVPACHPRLVEALGAPLARDTTAMSELFRDWRPSVVHAFLDWPNVAAGLAACIVGVPRIVLSGRNLSPPNLGLEHGALRPVYRRLLAHPHVTLVNNSAAGAGDYAKWLGIAPERIGVLRNGFRAPEREALPEPRASRGRLGLPEDGPLVGGIFRHAAEKDPELWLSVASNIRARRPEVRFVVFGDGPAVLRSERHLRMLGLGGSVILRPAHHPIAEVFDSIDVLLSTSRVEGTPNVLIEAQWHGVPVVATAVGGVPETIEDGVTGRLIASRDAATLADAVFETLAWHRRTPAFRQRGRDLVEARFSESTMIAATLRLYRNTTCASVAPEDASERI
jgi:glycosyltransferase involved in cell wall biosynthesis